MAYQTGTAVTSTDLLKQLVTFLTSNGWTEDLSQAEGSGWRAHLNNGANYVHLRAAENEDVWQSDSGKQYGLNVYMGTAFNSANAWNNQPTGAPVQSATTIPVGAAMTTSAGPFTGYFFFCDSGGQNVVVVLQKTSGVFAYIGWGASLNKIGAWTGGTYIFGSSSGFGAGSVTTQPGGSATANPPGTNGDAFYAAPCVYVRADVDSFTGKWISIGSDNIPAHGYTGKIGASQVFAPSPVGQPPSSIPAYGEGNSLDFQSEQTSQQDGRANLLPLLLWANRDSTTTGFSPLGAIPWVFLSNGVGNGFSATSVYTIGTDNYIMFPNFAVKKQ